jgi:ribosome-associated protein
VNASMLLREVVFKAVRSRGPGGQNVNRVASAAQATWYVEFSELLSDAEKARLREKAANWINSEGALHTRSDEFRDLERNKKRCIEKLLSIIKAALHVPKKRKATKPTRASKVKRRESKTRRAEVKKLRGRVDY